MINNLDLKTTKHLSTSLVHSNKNKNPDNQTTNRVNLYSEREYFICFTLSLIYRKLFVY